MALSRGERSAITLRRLWALTPFQALPAILVFLVFVLVPGTARAHAFLVSTSPASGARLGIAPSDVVLTFSEPLEEKLSAATVTDPSGQRFTARVSGTAMTADLATNVPGTYQVTWVSVSADDGHTLRGSFRFSVVASSGGGPAATTSDGSGFALPLLRGIEYVALLLSLGMLLVRRLARHEPPLPWVRVRLGPPLLVALLSGLVITVMESQAATGVASAASVRAFLTTGRPGLARLVMLAALTVAIVGARAGRDRFVLPPLIVALAAVAAAGHGASVGPRWLGIGVAAGHLVAAGAWAGGIMALATLRPPGGFRGPEARMLLDRFTPVALIAFSATIGLGVVQAFQDVGSFRALFHTTYGRFLQLKMLGVLAMVPLSLLAWRRRVAPRLEAVVAVFVACAAAILAAYPLPVLQYAGAAEAASTGHPRVDPAFPRPGDLTLGGRAGSVLVGLTLRPGRPGRNEMLIYVGPVQNESVASRLPIKVSVDGQSLPVTECSAWCREATAWLGHGATVTVHAGGQTGGTARFDIAGLPAQDGQPLFRRLQQHMHDLRTYRLDERFGTGASSIHSLYAFQAPDRFRVAEPDGFELVWIGGTRYQQQRTGSGWLVQTGSGTYRVPSFIWDYIPDVRLDFREVGRSTVDGTAVSILSFFGPEGGAPYWFRLWVDSRGLVLRAQMRGVGHFMDQKYRGFDAPIEVVAPAIPSTGT